MITDFDELKAAVDVRGANAQVLIDLIDFLKGVLAPKDGEGVLLLSPGEGESQDKDSTK